MAAFKTKKYWFMRNKLILLCCLFILNQGYKLEAQVYYPEVEWLQTGPICFSVRDKIQNDILLFKQESTNHIGKLVKWGVQEFDDNGGIKPFSDSNSITFNATNLEDVYVCNLEHYKFNDSNKTIKILLQPIYLNDSSWQNKSVLLEYDINSNKIKAINSKLEFEKFLVYNGIIIDSFLFFKISESDEVSNDRKYSIIKTDKQLNILVKYPFAGIMGNTARLHYWRGNIIIYGTSRIFEPAIDRMKEYPALFLHSPDDMRVLGKRVYKTPLNVKDVWMVSLNTINDTFMMGMTGWSSDDTYLLKIDSNFNMVDSTSYPQVSVIQYPVLNDEPIKILTALKYGSKTQIIYLSTLNQNPFQNSYKAYDIGEIQVNTPFTMCKKGNKYLIYGNRWEQDSTGTELVNRMFRIVLDSNGIPLKARRPPSSIADLNSLSPQINIFPNPSSGYITIENTTQNLPLELEIKDMHGRIIHTQQLNKPKTQLFLDIDAGIYYFSLSNGIYNHTKKIIISK
jgi:hypothetical protein